MSVLGSFQSTPPRGGRRRVRVGRGSVVARLGHSIWSRSLLAATLNVTATIVRVLEVRLDIRPAPVGPSLTYTLDEALTIEAALGELDPRGLLQRRPTGRRGRPPRELAAAD